MSEPSKEAIEAAMWEIDSKRHELSLGDIERLLKKLIDQACAQKDGEIERLKNERNFKAKEFAALKERIAELEASFDKYRNAHGENMAQYPKALVRIAAMSAILEKVPHVALRAIPPDSDSLHWDGITPGCHPDCPACQWEAMKAKP
jgi:chromosome segregation ATPase